MFFFSFFFSTLYIECFDEISPWPCCAAMTWDDQTLLLWRFPRLCIPGCLNWRDVGCPV
jgi:hypothetical protein